LVASRNTRAAIAAVAGLTLLAAVLRVWASTQGFFGDELFTWNAAHRDSFGDVLDGVDETENTPPLYYLLAWAVGKVFGPPEWMRLPAILAGVALVPVCALVARRVFGLGAAVVCAALVALSPFAVYYGSEARAYAPAALCVVLSTLLLLEGLERPRRRVWVGFAMAAAAGVWFHYTAALPLVAQAGWALWAHRERTRDLLLAHGGAALLYLPWLPFAERNASNDAIGHLGGGFAVEKLWEHPARALLGYPYQEVGEVPGLPLALLALAVLAVVGAIAARERPWTLPAPASPAWLLVLTALAAPAGTLLYSAASEYIFSPRYLLVSAPATLVLVSGLVGRRPARVAVPATAILVAVLAVSSVRTAFGDLRRPAYDRAGALIDREADPADPVIEFPNLGFLLGPPLSEPIRPFLRGNHVHVPGHLDAERGWRVAAAGSGRAWLVFTRDHDAPAPTEANKGRLEPAPDPRFREVSRHSWGRRLGDLTVVEYVLEP
jgi:mannosyltransferase